MNSTSDIKISRLNTAERMQAVYTLTGDPEFDSNPLITSLNPLPTIAQEASDMAQLFEDLNVMPDPPKNNGQQLSTILRKAKASQILDFHVPLDRDFELAHDIAIALRNGYIGRNPSAELLAGRPDRIAEFCAYQRRKAATSVICLAVTGVSGGGKTTIAKLLLRREPQVRLHDNKSVPFLPKKQLVWLAAECPERRSLRTLGLTIIKNADHVLGENYFAAYRNGSVDDILHGVAAIAENHFLGMLVIDETQFAINRRDPTDHEILDYIVQLANVIGVPILLIGTTKVLDLLEKELRAARRFIGRTWDRFHIQSPEYCDFLTAFWKYHFTSETPILDVPDDDPLRQDWKLPPNTGGMYATIYDVTQGIPALITSIISLAQRREIGLGGKMVTVDTIRSVYADYFKSLHPVIEALKSGDDKLIERFEDLVQKRNIEKLLAEAAAEEEANQRQILRRRLGSFRKRLERTAKAKMANDSRTQDRYQMPKSTGKPRSDSLPEIAARGKDAIQALEEAGVFATQEQLLNQC